MAYAPFFCKVFIPRAERVTRTDLFNSGTKTFLVCIFAYLRLFPVGLNCVARVRFEYPPTTRELFFVTGHTFAIVGSMLPFQYNFGNMFPNDPIQILFFIAVLIMSVVLHELAHGYAALYRGDPTAKYEGRLTLNPVSHLDPIGSFLVPLITYVAGGFLFGWARPVPYNPYNLRNPRFDEAFIAIAGPVTNICIAALAALAYRALAYSESMFSGVEAVSSLLIVTVVLNVGLAIFNMVPIPPLDGSKILFSLLPARLYHLRVQMESYALILFVFFVFFLSSSLSPIVSAVAAFLLGV